MIQKLSISGVHMAVDDDLHKYVVKKIGTLDQYVPRKARQSIHTDIKLKESKAKDKKEWTCEIVFHVPHSTLEVQESAINMYAAVDIAEAKLRAQLHKYKDLHAGPRLHRRLLARFKQRAA
jgi:ribosomal subunit interface protein